MTEKLYGVWIPNIGWLKTHNGAVAFEHYDVAEATAKRIGASARVEFIDDSLKDLENQLLQAEKEQPPKRTLWHILTNYSGKRTSNP
jgi:hypothetical protein